jgi:hypothetical protein
VLAPYDLDERALSAAPCELQLVLLPYGQGKQAKGEARRWTRGLQDAKALQAWALEAVGSWRVAACVQRRARPRCCAPSICRSARALPLAHARVAPAMPWLTHRCPTSPCP